MISLMEIYGEWSITPPNRKYLNTDNIIGKRILKIMGLPKINIDDLSCLTKIDKRKLQRIISGQKKKVRCKDIFNIADSLNVSWEYLAGVSNSYICYFNRK